MSAGVSVAGTVVHFAEKKLTSGTLCNFNRCKWKS